MSLQQHSDCPVSLASYRYWGGRWTDLGKMINRLHTSIVSIWRQLNPVQSWRELQDAPCRSRTCRSTVLYHYFP